MRVENSIKREFPYDLRSENFTKHKICFNKTLNEKSKKDKTQKRRLFHSMNLQLFIEKKKLHSKEQNKCHQQTCQPCAKTERNSFLQEVFVEK